MGSNRILFSRGDSMASAEFREALNVVSLQAADGVSWTWGPGLQGSYSPGTGFTLALDPVVIPTVRRSSFVAKITGYAGAAHAWTEQATTGEGTWENKTDGRSGTTGARSAFELNGREGVALGTLVTLWEVLDTSNTVRYQFDLGTGLVETEEDAEEVGIAGPGEVEERADIWDRESGLTAKVWFMTRVHSDKGGALYGYQRMLELDTNGHVFKIGEEERYVIDSTTNCEGA